MAQDYQMKAGQGSAFPKNKTKDTQPDFSGELLTPSGEKLEISMWWKAMKNDGKFLSISVKPPFVPQKQQDDFPADNMPDCLK